MLFLKGLVLIYGLYAGVLYTAQRSMLFPVHVIEAPPEPRLPDAQSELLQFSVGDATVEAWWLAPLDEDGMPAPAMIVSHGNGEIIDYLPEQFLHPRLAGWGVLLVEFPGYGRSTGQPSEDSIRETMRHAYDWLVQQPQVDAGRIIAYGRSIGGGAACALASERQLAGLVLQSTFTSVRSFAGRYLLPGFLVRDPFDNVAVVREFSGVLRILHGRHDEMIPFRHGEILAETGGVPLQVQDCGHNDCMPSAETYWEALLPYLEQELRIREAQP